MSKPEHPTSEQLQRLSQGNLAPAVLDQIAEHVDQCETCAEALATVPKTSLEAKLPGAYDKHEAVPETAAPASLGTLGSYSLIRELKAGGMGVVYVAKHLNLEELYVVKTIKPEFAGEPGFAERFEREAKILAQLDSDYIVKIHDFGKTPMYYMAMPLLKGETLEDRLDSKRALPLQEVVRLAREMVSGLKAAHEKELIHRDLKPNNLFLEIRPDDPARPRLKILDFGLARPIVDHADLTQAGYGVGTPGYMAPEQFSNPDGLDQRTDLFALGCVLYRMTTGKLPFPRGFEPRPGVKFPLASWQKELLDADCRPIPPRELNAGVPLALNDLILRLLETDPARRPGSAREVAGALEAIQLAEDTAPPRPAPKRRRWAPVAAAVALLVLLGVGILFGAQITRVVTNQGVLVVEVNDPTVEVKIVQNGVVVVVTRDEVGKREFTLTAGKGEIEVREKDGIKLMTRQFELTRGGQTTVKVTLRDLAEAREEEKRKLAAILKKDKEKQPPDQDSPHGLLYRMTEHVAAVDGVALSPDGSLGFSTGKDNSIRFWDLNKGVQIKSLRSPEPALRGVISPDGRFAFVGTAKDFTCWELPSLKGHFSYGKPHLADGGVRFIAVSSNSKTALTTAFVGGSSGTRSLQWWNLNTTLSTTVRKTFIPPSAVGALAFAPGDEHGLMACYGSLFVLDLEPGKSIREVKLPSPPAALPMVFSGDGKWLMYMERTDPKKTLRYDEQPELKGFVLFDWKTEKILLQKETGDRPITALALSHDGRRALSASSADSLIRLWDLPEGKEIKQFESHKDKNTVTCLCFSRDGRFALSGSKDGSVCLWRLPDAEKSKDKDDKTPPSAPWPTGAEPLTVSLKRKGADDVEVKVKSCVMTQGSDSYYAPVPAAYRSKVVSVELANGVHFLIPLHFVKKAVYVPESKHYVVSLIDGSEFAGALTGEVRVDDKISYRLQDATLVEVVGAVAAKPPPAKNSTVRLTIAMAKKTFAVYAPEIHQGVLGFGNKLSMTVGEAKIVGNLSEYALVKVEPGNKITVHTPMGKMHQGTIPSGWTLRAALPNGCAIVINNREHSGFMIETKASAKKP